MLSSKAKRAKCSTHKQRVIVMLYNKVCDIVSNISELLEIQLLTDTTILQVKTFFHLSVYSGYIIFDKVNKLEWKQVDVRWLLLSCQYLFVHYNNIFFLLISILFYFCFTSLSLLMLFPSCPLSQVSSMGITPFFVENVSELQLCAIKLVTAVSFVFFFFLFKNIQYLSEDAACYVSVDVFLQNHLTMKLKKTCLITSCHQVFSRYEKHRQLILEEIFTSLARLPTSKRSLRNFRYVVFFNQFTYI